MKKKSNAADDSDRLEDPERPEDPDRSEDSEPPEDSDTSEDVLPRLLTPQMTSTQRRRLERYCQRYHQKLGPGMLLAAMREIRREFDLPEDY